jgi:hypothetical protein
VIENETHDYVIHNSNFYERTIEIEGFNVSDKDELVSFPVNELSELVSVQSQEYGSGYWRNSKINKHVRVSTLDWSSFYSGIKRYYYRVPANSHFRFVFKTKEKHTILLSKLYKKGYFDAANTSFGFQLPNELMLSTSYGNHYEMEHSFNQNDFDSIGEIAYLIHDLNVEPKAYFSSWFESRIEPQLDLSEESVPEELVQLSKEKSRDELAKACFQYVQREVKYIDIENGINAFVPRNCEIVLSRKLGDCKDMATVLVSLYRHFGFEAYFGVSRTNSKEGVFDFPSVGLANHAICVLKLNDTWIYLDATEDACLFGDPSLQILNSEVFLVGHGDTYFLEVPQQPTWEAKANFTYEISNDRIQLEIETSGKMNRFLYGISLKKNDVDRVVIEALNYFTKLDWTLDSLNISDTISRVKLSTPILNSTMTRLKGKDYIDLSFLLSPELNMNLFQSNEFPLYSTQLTTKILFTDTILSSFDTFQSGELKVKADGNVLTIEQSYAGSASEESFLESDLILNWKTFLEKPIIIKNAQ